MVDFLRQHWLYFLGAAVLHLLFAGLFAVTLIQMSSNMPPPQLAIQAMVVDSSVVTQAARQRQREREQAEAREREKAALAKRRQEEQVALEAAEQQAEQARQNQAREQREREEAEKQRQATAERERREAAERQRVADIERKQKEAAQRRQKELDAKAQAAAEADLKRQLEEEENVAAAMQSGALGDYEATIQQLLYRKWNKPPSARPGLECEVKITQAPNGVVLTVAIGRCNGDSATRASIETAVTAASPLPLPRDMRLFVRNLTLIFKPE